MKKVSILLAALMLIICMPVTYAYEFPKAVWAPSDAYNAAVAAGDTYGIIEYGKKIVEILEKEPQNQQVCEFAGSRCEAVAKAYEKLGEYDASAEYFIKYIPYAKALGYDDAVKIATAKARQFTSRLNLYVPKSYNEMYFGAKNEPERGILYGVTADSHSLDDCDHASMMLLYINFGDDSQFGYAQSKMHEAHEKGVAVEVAWNIPGEGNEIGNIRNYEEHIAKMMYLIKRIPELPVYLRFAAEFDVWGVPADAEVYKESFRYIADRVHKEAPNAAVVWSPNIVSNWNIDRDSYYPGDEYVDWVGVSLYMNKYFLGRNDWSENEKFNEIIFGSGNSADPVIDIEEIIEKYGDRKPIMISEAGASHYINTLHEDATGWAKIYLRKMYDFIPLVYPQVKLIAYFDKEMNETNNYALSANPQLLEEFKLHTHHKWYIQRGYDTALEFEKEDTAFVTEKANTFLAYVHTFADNKPILEYYIDGKLAGTKDHAPYMCNVNFNEEGQHTLELVAKSNGKILVQKAYTVTVTDGVSIMIDDMKIKSDVNPVLVSGRTLVPVRLIAENLGATVEWEAETSTVTVTRDETVIKLRMGEKKMYKNGQEIALDVAAQEVDGRTMLPVRAVGEALSCGIDWDGNTNAVIINR